MEPRLGQAASLGQLDERHLIRPRVMPPLDPAFRPAALAAARFFERVRESPSGRPAWLAVEQPDGTVSHHESWALAEGPDAASSARSAQYRETCSNRAPGICSVSCSTPGVTFPSWW